MKNFGEYIKYRRKNIMTQKEFANKIGIGCPYLSKLENGIEPPPSEKILRLMAKELAIKESELFYLAQKIPVELREFILENKNTYDLLIKLFECPELLRHNFLKDMMILFNKHDYIFSDAKEIKLLINPANTKIVDVNKAAIEFYGFTKEEFADKSIMDINPLPKELLKLKMNQVISGSKDYFYFTHKLADNSYRDVFVKSKPYRLGNHTYLLSIVSEV